jgi:hypothetical protein
LTVSDTTNIK